MSANYHVIVGSRSLEKGQQAANEIEAGDIKGSLSLVQLDVTSESSIQAAGATVEKDHGRLDVLINNAGTGSWEAETLVEKIKVCFETNALGAVLVTEAFKPLLLRSERARIIFVSSGAGSVSRTLDSNSPNSNVRALPYRMSKAAMNMAMAEYQAELRDQGVVVQAMSPGFVHTNLRRDKEPLPGTLPAETAAETLLSMMEGKRDTDSNKLIRREGVNEW